jgi:rubrerythrin
MNNELYELLESAIFKEIASEARYKELQKKADDPGAVELMKELAEQEEKHAVWLTAMRDKSSSKKWHKGAAEDLRITDHLAGPDTLENAGLQDTLVFAIKREQASVDFYSRMTGLLSTKLAKRISQRLVNEEIRHKVKLEILYDGLFLGEN